MPQPAEESAGTVSPILIAFGVAALVLIAVIAMRMVRGDEVRAEAGVGRAVVGQNDALQRENYPDFRRFTCSAGQGTESAVLSEQRRSSAARGARVVDDVSALKVDGDRATATVVYHFEKASGDKVATAMSFLREGGEWKVCSPGPR